MKTLAFAVLLLSTGGFAAAQQVSLLEDGTGGVPSTSAVTGEGMPQVLVPKDEAPAVTTPASAEKPVKKVIDKRKKNSAVAVSPESAKGQPAGFPFEAVKPEELPAAALVPQSAAAAKPAETVKPPAEVKPVPRAEPEKTVKPAATIKPAAAEPAVVQAPQAIPGAGFAVGKTHTVTGGDTLWDLSARYYKDPYKWGKIYNANLGTIKNPDRIYPSEELVIPGLTEEVKPGADKAAAVAGVETVKEGGAAGSDVLRAEVPAQAAAAAPAPAKTAAAELGDMLKEFDANDLSEEMPRDQKEWSAGVTIVPDSWQEDGTVSGAEKGEDEEMANSLSIGGDVVLVELRGGEAVKSGDYLAVYLKGATAYDKAGKKLGREIQRAGALQVLSADGGQVRAKVVEALTAITKGYVVKKK